MPHKCGQIVASFASSSTSLLPSICHNLTKIILQSEIHRCDTKNKSSWQVPFYALNMPDQVSGLVHIDLGLLYAFFFFKFNREPGVKHCTATALSACELPSEYMESLCQTECFAVFSNFLMHNAQLSVCSPP